MNMTQPGGMNGKILRVDLTTGKAQAEELDSKDVQKFLGGRGLGAALLLRELQPGIEPLSPQNKLIFSIGPLTGTGLSGTSKYAVHTKSPLTGIYLFAVSSRHFGPELKKCGYDALIVEGKAAEPSYLLVTDDKVEVRKAAHLWGLTTDHTEKFVQREVSGSARVASIGPAGENLVPYACIINDEGRAAGRGGAGAVMGSKNLKAIALQGSQRVTVADADAYKALLKRAVTEIQNNPRTEKIFQRYGTSSTVSSMNEAGIMPFRNWQMVRSPIGDQISGDVMRENYLICSTNCPPCITKCSKLCAVKEGPYAGTVSEGPEYETIYAFGGCCEFADFGAILYADAFCDRYGLDTMSTGVSIGFAMECYERGIIGPGDTGGLELQFGDHQSLPKLLHDIAYRHGFGNVLAEGTRRMSEQFGQGSQDFAMQAKGMELGGYDPRGVKGMALVYACGPRGGCHHAGGRTIPQEVSSGQYDRFTPEGKGALVKDSREQRVLVDSAVICSFTSVQKPTLTELISAATGFDFSLEDLYHLSDRVSNVERAFNVREGVRREADTLPRRLLNEPLEGQVVELDTLLDDFYAACGWDPTTGIPTRQKLHDLDLDDIANQLGLV
jgi:aldehyde:ferredoxin oxidoreductase